MRFAKWVFAAIALMTSTAHASVNIIPSHWTSMFWAGNAGILRSGSPWGPGSTASSPVSIVDGVFAPENQQWNIGSFWWDEQASGTPIFLTIQLDQSYVFDRFIIQADDNDAYQLEYWTGSTWANAFTATAVNTFGLVTRDSGALDSLITTNRFRLSAVMDSGDQYFAFSELQAFAVETPEPASWVMLIIGFSLIGATMRRRRDPSPVFANVS
jgi:hypothetical protein